MAGRSWEMVVISGLLGELGDHIQVKQSKQILQPLLSEYLTLTDIQM